MSLVSCLFYVRIEWDAEEMMLHRHRESCDVVSFRVILLFAISVFLRLKVPSHIILLDNFPKLSRITLKIHFTELKKKN